MRRAEKGAVAMLEVIKTVEGLVRKIMDEYYKAAVELSECYFTNVIVDMSKSDFIKAYSEIQWHCNGDKVVRLNNNLTICGPISDETIPRKWNWTRVGGDAEQILLAINEERLHGGPIFARQFDADTLLDLVYGPFVPA